MRPDYIPDERAVGHVRKRANLRLQLLHSRLCCWSTARSDAGNAHSTLDLDPKSGDLLVCVDVLHLLSDERLAAVCHPLLSRPLREWIFSSHDCECSRGQAIAAVDTNTSSTWWEAGTQRRSAASALHFSTALQPLRACSVDIFRPARTKGSTGYTARRAGSGCTLSVV